jgi:hypothetical protein
VNYKISNYKIVDFSLELYGLAILHYKFEVFYLEALGSFFAGVNHVLSEVVALVLYIWVKVLNEVRQYESASAAELGDSANRRKRNRG